MSDPKALTPKQRQHLKGLAHGLQPTVQVGAAGVSDGVLEALDNALETHELVKVRIGKGPEGDERRELANELAAGARAQLCQVIGRVVVLYRARKRDPKIVLPRA